MMQEWSLGGREIETPCYVVDESLLEANLKLLRDVADRAGCKILLAQKAFSMFHFYPLIGRYLDGTAASGLHEAKLGRDYMDKENHVFSAGYADHEFDQILAICDHVVFNSFTQWVHFRDRALAAGKVCGIRINPEYSTQKDAIYDPCAPGSRLGVTLAGFRPDLLEGISGLHFHTLCEQDADALIRTLEAVEQKFSSFFRRLKWINFGGGHHITQPGYDIAALVDCILRFKERYGLEVYLEPGEAVALNAGFLVSTVLDVVRNRDNIAILDTSAACHMPDVLEMPYRPNIIGAGYPGEKAYTYTLGGPTCLAGDVIGSYSFDNALKPEDRLVFSDMAIYSMVKNNTFNGINLPSIAALDRNGRIQVLRRFGYEDFRMRLS